MSFRKLAPQVWEHSDGYRVQSAGMFSVEYIETLRKASVVVERLVGGTAIYTDGVSGWYSESGDVPMTDVERSMAIDRVASAFDYDNPNAAVVRVQQQHQEPPEFRRSDLTDEEIRLSATDLQNRWRARHSGDAGNDTDNR